MGFNCPVCGFTDLPRPPEDFLICPCCGTEFGLDDAEPMADPEMIFRRLRAAWIDRGMPWFSLGTPPPPNWNALSQLEAAGLIDTKWVRVTIALPLYREVALPKGIDSDDVRIDRGELVNA